MLLYHHSYNHSGTKYTKYFVSLEVSSLKKINKMWGIILKDGKKIRKETLYWDRAGEIIYEENLSNTLVRFSEVIAVYKRKLEVLNNNPEKNKDGSISKLYLKKIERTKTNIEYYQRILNDNFSNAIQYILEE